MVIDLVLTVDANSRPSAHLSSAAVLNLAGAFIAVTAFWTVALYRHVRVPDTRAA